MVSYEIIKVLDDLGRRFGIAIDWTNSNMVPYLQQLGQRIVNYKLGMSVFYLIIGILVMIVSIKAIKFIIHRCSDDDDITVDLLTMFIAPISIVAGVIAFIFVCDCIENIIACMTLPEKVILQQCMDIMKTYQK